MSETSVSVQPQIPYIRPIARNDTETVIFEKVKQIPSLALYIQILKTTTICTSKYNTWHLPVDKLNYFLIFS